LVSKFSGSTLFVPARNRLGFFYQVLRRRVLLRLSYTFLSYLDSIFILLYSNGLFFSIGLTFFKGLPFSIESDFAIFFAALCRFALEHWANAILRHFTNFSKRFKSSGLLALGFLGIWGFASGFEPGFELGASFSVSRIANLSACLSANLYANLVAYCSASLSMRLAQGAWANGGWR
jgi:hypothetical protein